MQQASERMLRTLFHACRAVVCALLVAGLFLPFLMPTGEAGDDAESVGLLPSIPMLAEAGGGPFSEAAVAASVLVGGYALVVLAALASMAMLPLMSETGVRVAHWIAVVLLIGSLGAWLLSGMLAAQWDGRVSAFPPAVICLILAGVGAILLTRRQGSDKEEFGAADALLRWKAD